MSLIGVIMLMGLVAKNAILLLDCARKEEEQGVDREEALMHAGRVRLRPILMTTFALIAGMMPVAIGLGEGGEFYRPMAVAIIGGTITSTLLTLLVVPTFYDSIEISRERAALKFHARAAYGNPFVAFMTTFAEVLLTLVFLRFFFRVACWALIPCSSALRPLGTLGAHHAKAVRTPGRASRAAGRFRGARRFRRATQALAAQLGAPASTDAPIVPKPTRWKPIKAS